MISMISEVVLKNVTGHSIGEFLINCTDEDYRQWWPGTHFQFHTIKRYPDEVGNLVFFDEYVGKYRLKFKGVVIAYIPGKKIVWQIKKLMKLPAWLVVSFHASEDSLTLIHEVKAGYKGVGRILDPFIRIRLSKSFEQELDKHAQYEFRELAEHLQRQKA